MSTVRYAFIVGALFAVLLSAFHIERRRSCADDGMACLAGKDTPLLPLSRLLIELRERRQAGTSGRNAHEQ